MASKAKASQVVITRVQSSLQYNGNDCFSKPNSGLHQRRDDAENAIRGQTPRGDPMIRFPLALSVCGILIAMQPMAPAQQFSESSLEAADSRLNHFYTVLRVGLTDSQQIALRHAQRAWINYRDEAATVRADPNPSKMDAAVLAELTVEQTELLQTLRAPNFVIATGSAATELKSAEVSLNVAFHRLRENGALTEQVQQTQRAWLVYRDAFAAAYAAVHGEPDDQERIQAAAAKLTDLRTAHLRKLLEAETGEALDEAASSGLNENTVSTGDMDAIENAGDLTSARNLADSESQLILASRETSNRNTSNEPEIGQIAQAQEQASPEIIEVKAEGLGVDAEGARKNALARAVETAVGLVVDAETLVKNDELVRDQVLTYSDAIVTDYEELSVETRTDGLVAIRIAAKVQRRKLIERLEANNISMKQVDTSGVYATVVTARKNAADAEALLLKTLRDFDYPFAFLRAELASEMPELLGESPSNLDSSITRWTIRLSYDREAYFETLVPKLKEVLIQVSSERPRENPFEFYKDLPDSMGSKARFDRPRENEVIVLTRLNESMTNGSVTYYALAGQLFDKIKQQSRSFDPHDHPVRVTWFDASDDIVAQKEVVLVGDDRPGSVRPEVYTTWFYLNNALVSCLFNYAPGYSDGGYVTSFVRHVDQEFTDSELAAIQRVQVEFVE